MEVEGERGGGGFAFLNGAGDKVGCDNLHGGMWWWCGSEVGGGGGRRVEVLYDWGCGIC